MKKEQDLMDKLKPFFDASKCVCEAERKIKKSGRKVKKCEHDALIAKYALGAVFLVMFRNGGTK